MSNLTDRLRLYIRFEHPTDYEKHIVWQAADEIEQLREDMRRIAFNALKRHMILGASKEKYIEMMEANNNSALWQCLEYVGKIAKDSFERGE